MKHLILFDIDGTLLSAGGAGITSFNKAFQEVFGVESAWGDTLAHGKTDPQLVREICSRLLKRDVKVEEQKSVQERYLFHFPEELRANTRFRLLPGAKAICTQLHQEQDVLLGLETGNLEPSAWLKLERGALRDYFSFGGFGSDSEDRRQIVSTAIERAKERLKGEPLSTVVIGDAPQDIQAGKDNGARTIAMTTGRYKEDELAQFRADVILDDLSGLTSELKRLL